MTQVKICGIRQPDHALAAAQAGADYIGLVFVPRKRRGVNLEAARDIIDQLKSSCASPPQVVGLFADQPPEYVDRLARACGLDAVQLCGRESLDYCDRLAVPVIKVIHVRPLSGLMAGQSVSSPADFDLAKVVSGLGEHLRLYREAGHLVTLDRLVDGLQGGTGESFNWEIAVELSRQGHSFLLAGGLDPDNVTRAIARVQPWGVDVSSGVETQGVKDPEKIRAFIRNARSPQQQGVQE